MGMIDSTIRLKNQMTPVLDSIISSMNMVISSAYDVKTATGQAFDTSSLEAARENLNQAAMAVENAKNEQVEFNKKLEDGQHQAGKLTKMLKGAAATYLSLRGAKAFVGLSDEMTQIKARLDNINDGHQTTLELQEMIYQSTQRARGEYKTTLDIVSKLGAQAKDTFNTNQETIAFAENLNKLFTISGTTETGMESVMYNLTQAMAMGVLRGQDLNAVMSNTPQLLQIVADYMGVNVGQIKTLAEEGQLTADIIKNALIGATDEINEQFENMPVTFGQIAMDMKNRFIHGLEPAITMLNDFANSDRFKAFADRAGNAIDFVTQAITGAVTIGIEAVNLVADAWEYLETPIIAVVGAMASYKAITLMVAGAEAAKIAITTGLAAAKGLYALATGQATSAQVAFNTALLTNPITWVAGLVGIATALYLRWAKSVGGLGIAHKITVSNIKTLMGGLVVATKKSVSDLIYTWDMFRVGMGLVKNGVLNALDTMKVKGLEIVQSLINGVINGINKLINMVNRIPGVGIEAIEQVSFAANAKVEAQARQKDRANELQKSLEMAHSNKEIRDRAIDILDLKFRINRLKREREIARLKADKAQDADYKLDNTKNTIEPILYTDLPDVAKDLKKAKEAASGTKKNTDKLKDGIEVKNDDIAHLKDLAEMRAIQNFSFEKLEVVANNSFGDVHETADLDGWMDSLTDNLEEAVSATMGGVIAYE